MPSFLIILAGGESRRFQQDGLERVDKCLFPVNGEPMIMRIIKQATVFDDIIIAGGVNSSKYVNMGLRVIGDSERFSGVLAGVDSASSLNGVLVFSPCDTPNVTTDVFKVLLSNGPLSVFVLPNGLVESHLFRIDSSLLRTVINEAAAHGRSRLSDLFRLSNVVNFLSPLSHGIKLTSFLNVNRRIDLMGFNLRGPIVFTNDVVIRWSDPPLLRLLRGEGDAEALLWDEARVYVSKGILSLAAHALRDLERRGVGYGAVANAILNLIGAEK